VRFLALVFFLMMAAQAWADPSFDCESPTTAIEKTICSDQNPGLAMRDGVIGRLYEALKQEQGHGAVIAAQSDWLQSRDVCGPNPECLARRYDERLAVLAKEAGDTGGVTGSYHYKLGDGSDEGDAFVVRDSDGTLSGTIDTVAGPTSHTCDVTFDGANPIGDAWVWDDPTAPDDAEDFCRILFRPGQMSLRIDSDSCQTYCGARGYFDQTYSKHE
jgi:hypothetical protein